MIATVFSYVFEKTQFLVRNKALIFDAPFQKVPSSLSRTVKKNPVTSFTSRSCLCKSSLKQIDSYVSTINSFLVTAEYIRLQELTFLSEYYFVTSLFCFTLFVLFSLKFVPKENSFDTKFLYSNHFVFLLIFLLLCYLILIFQQYNMTSMTLTSFNDTINNDFLSLISKSIIGIFCIFYLLFINKFLEKQKLHNFEYYVILMTSILGFFLLCCANDFITSYLAIELQGLAFYVLAAFKKSSNFSVESGIKYFVLGSLSTALFLLGVTLIYGFSGSILFTDFQDLFREESHSAGAFLAALNSMSFILNSLQESGNCAEDFEYTKLKSISEELLHIKDYTEGETEKQVGTLENELFNNFIPDSQNLSISTSCSVAERLLEHFNENFESSILTSSDSIRGEFVDINFLRVFTLLLSINDLSIENSYLNNFFLSSGYFLKDSALNFISLKNCLYDSNFYESAEMLVSSDSDFFAKILLDDHVEVEESNELFIQKFNSSFLSCIQSYLITAAQISNCDAFFNEFFEVNSEVLLHTFDSNFAVIGVLILILALFFKLALAPFHLWSPDVYEGSPSSSTFFFMVLSKFGIFVFLLRLCYSCFYSFVFYWQYYSLIIASISVIVGALAGLKQRKMKSLLTYSSINNMGFVLLAFSAGNFEGIQMKFFYLIVYMLGSITIWSLILNLQLKRNDSEKQNRELGDLILIQESNNIVAQNLGITLFSLAGLPPMVGFFAKVGVFIALSSASIFYFSIVNILFSVVATFYYLRIIKIIFFENSLVGNLYSTVSSKKVFIINFLAFLLLFFFVDPLFLHLYSYKITLLFNKFFF